MKIKTFYLNRIVDVSGVSGTGKVAEGVLFSNGWVAVSWLTENTSVCVYNSIESAIAIHGHNGNTEFVWEVENED